MYRTKVGRWYTVFIRYLNKWWAKYCWLKIYLLLTCRVSSFHYSMGSGTTETWSRHFVREPKGSPPSAVPFRGPKRIWDIKYGYSTFRNRLRTYETLLFPYGWKPYKYGRKWRIDSCGIHQDKKTAERTTIFCFVVVSGTQRGEKLTTSSERVDPGTERRKKFDTD